MPKPRKYRINGTSLTTKDMAGIVGISYKSMAHRIKQFPRSLWLLPCLPRRKPKRYRINGKLLTIQEMADQVDISYKGMVMRIRNLPRSLWLSPKRSPKLINYQGDWLTITEIAQRLGVHRACLDRRIRNLPKSQWFDIPQSTKYTNSDGITDTASGWARRLGISRQAFDNRLTSGTEDLFGPKRQGRAEDCHLFNGQWYKTSTLAGMAGISAAEMSRRIRKFPDNPDRWLGIPEKTEGDQCSTA